MKKYFLTGLASLLPVAVTIWVIVFIVNFLTKPFIGFVSNLLSSISLGPFRIFATDTTILIFSQFLILIGLFLLTILLGIVTRWVIFNALLRFSDQILHKIPFINKVYKTTKDIISTLFTSNKNSFKDVVLIRFPNRQTYSLGLVTRDAPMTCSQATSTEMVTVFIPSTPNLMTGFLIVSDKSDLIYLNMKTEEAIKYIVSIGVTQPTRNQ